MSNSKMTFKGRRNLVLKVSIVINVAVFLYMAMHMTGSPNQPMVEWIPTGYDSGPNRVLSSVAETQARKSEISDDKTNSTKTTVYETGTGSQIVNNKYIPDVTVQKIPPTELDLQTSHQTLKTITSTEEEKIPVPSPNEVEGPVDQTEKEEDLDQQDENALSDATLTRLKNVLACYDKDFLPSTRQRGEFTSLVNYVRADHGHIMCQETVTYTTHAGFEFLDNVVPLVERWMAPVSLAIHAPGSDFEPTINSIRYLRDCTGSDLVKNFVTFHIFFSHKHIPSSIPAPESFLSKPYNCSPNPPYVVNASATYMRQKNLLYPINVARNLARDAALTHFVLACDIELYPSLNLAPRFLNMVARNEKPLNTSTNPRLFPISIFEVSDKVQVPSTKTDLQKMLANKTAIPFHKFVCPNCHNIPQGPQWMKEIETEYMDVFHVGKRQGKFIHWEPIFIGTNSDPFYDERLSWEGKQDKMTQGYILCVKNYDFMILNNAFLIHKPGIKMYKKNSKRDSIAAKQSKLIKQLIFPEYKKLYGTRSGCAV